MALKQVVCARAFILIMGLTLKIAAAERLQDLNDAGALPPQGGLRVAASLGERQSQEPPPPAECKAAQGTLKKFNQSLTKVVEEGNATVAYLANKEAQRKCEEVIVNAIFNCKHANTSKPNEKPQKKEMKAKSEIQWKMKIKKDRETTIENGLGPDPSYMRPNYTQPHNSLGDARFDNHTDLKRAAIRAAAEKNQSDKAAASAKKQRIWFQNASSLPKNNSPNASNITTKSSWPHMNATWWADLTTNITCADGCKAAKTACDRGMQHANPPKGSEPRLKHHKEPIAPNEIFEADLEASDEEEFLM